MRTQGCLTEDWSTLERNAYQRGDYREAELFGLLMDAEERVIELETDEESDSRKWSDRYDRTQEAWSEHNEKMRQRLDNLRQLIEQAARVSSRELILERIADMQTMIDETEG